MSRLHPEAEDSRIRGRTREPLRNAGGVEDDRVRPQPGERSGPRLGEAPFETSPFRHPEPWLGHLEAVEEDHGVGGGRVAHVLEGEGVGALLEDSRGEVGLDHLLPLAVPGGFGDEGAVQGHAEVVVGIGLEVAGPLQPDLQLARAPRVDVGRGDGWLLVTGETSSSHSQRSGASSSAAW